MVGNLDTGGAPLLALHGGPGSTHNYFAPLEGLATERTVVLYDQIGCGKSDRPQDIEWSVAVFCDELLALRDQLGLDRIHLLGTSWGGMLALEHALAHLGAAPPPLEAHALHVALLLAGARPTAVRGAIVCDGPGLAGGGQAIISGSVVVPTDPTQA